MVYVIVLSYHAPEDLRRCLGSVLRADYPPERFRVVVVDNEATAETAAVLQEYAGQMDVLPQRENTGYARGMNIGIRHALAAGAEYVVVLNQDTLVESDWLRHLVMAMESDRTIGAAQARVMLAGSTDGHGLHGSDDGLVNSIGNHIHVFGFGFAGGHREQWGELRRRLTGFPYPEVTYPSGAAVMLRADAVRDVAVPGAEPFEERYFMYHEDLDLGVRLWLGGWRCVLAPQAVVWHAYQFSRSMQKLFWMERNRWWFLLENFRLPTLLLLAPMLIPAELGLLVIAYRNGWAREKLRAWCAALAPSALRTVMRQRHAKQAKRRNSDRVIIKRLTTRISNQEMPNAFVERFVDPVISAWWRIVRNVVVW
ncbi:MAG: glycosyltransferase family 2 protein [bacterium]|nr:glycosyltransferase family 2 protein [bacterium]